MQMEKSEFKSKIKLLTIHNIKLLKQQEFNLNITMICEESVYNFTLLSLFILLMQHSKEFKSLNYFEDLQDKNIENFQFQIQIFFQMFGITGGTNMRGLNEFISDIRACKDKQSESKRVQTQLAKIRQRFTTEKGLNAYQRKKYVWKLLYIHILGYEVDFGFQEASNLINSSKYDQKYTGYIASSLLISESNDQIWRSIVHSIQADIRSKNQAAQSLALSLIATIVPDLLVAALSDTIIDLAVSSKSTPNVSKKAIMCLSRIIKKHPNNYDVKKFITPLSEMFDRRGGSLSYQNAAASFLLQLMSLANPDTLIQIQPKVVKLVHKLALYRSGSGEVSGSYVYFEHANPWLQMKLYKALQLWSVPMEKGVLTMIEEVLGKVLKKISSSKSVNKNNTEYGLLFEVINLTIHYDKSLNGKLLDDVSKILVVFITSNQANIRYLGLEAMCRLAIKQNLSMHLEKILPNLDDKDISIRRRSLDLLYLICNHENVSKIVAELLGYLQARNDPLIRDDLVLKIAILAEMFAENLIWYVDVVVKLIQNAEVQNDIWYRIIQIITGFGTSNKQLQQYAAFKLFQTLTVPHITETSKCVGSYVVAEFSQYLVKAGKTPTKIYEAINKHFQASNNKSKAMMLNAFAKLAVKYEELRSEVQMICHMCSQHWDPDVQQRGIEYIALFDQNQEIQRKVLSQNPVFTQEQQQANPLLKKFAKKSSSSKLQSESVASKSTVGKSTMKSFAETGSTSVTNSATSHPLSTHPCFKKAIDRLCPNLVNLLDLPGKLDLKPYWKQALVKKSNFDECQIKQKFQDGVLKIILVVQVQTTEMQFKVFRAKGFDVTNSPVKYTPQNQQIMLTFSPTGQRIEPPTVGVAWKNQLGKISKKQIQLPIAITKFLSPVDLEYEKFNAFYKDYSLPNEKFHKLDSFLKLPEGVRGQDYLKKIGSFLSSVCNFKCGAYPSFDNIEVIYASATFPLKLNDKPVKYPILIEAQAYESDKTRAVRVSLRGGNSNSLASLYQTFLSFFSD